MKRSTSTYFLDKRIAERHIENGTDFILTHLPQPYWPRTISTKLTDNKQIIVNSRLEALSYFKDADYLDCRISAYSPDSKVVGPVMIDVDPTATSNGKSDKQELNQIKTKILSKIHSTFRIPKSRSPVTIIWSGNGTHYILPGYSNGKIISRKSGRSQKNQRDFMQFVEWYLSNGRCDIKHNTTVSFNNCLLRIPGSVNSKNGGCQVRIEQKWDGVSKVDLSRLYNKFLVHLTNGNYRQLRKKTIKPLILSKNGTLSRHQQQQLKIVQQFCRCHQRKSSQNRTSNILWIEILLQTPLYESRKYCVWRILTPYLINVRHLSFDKSYDIIDKWLIKCNKLEELDFDSDYKINEGLNRATEKGFFPVSFDNSDKEPRTLKTENRELYNVLKRKLKENGSVL